MANENESKKDAFVGLWQGVIKAAGQELRLVFHISVGSDGLVATVDSPDQGATGIPVETVTVTGATIRLDVASTQGSYEGSLSADGAVVFGHWDQAGSSFAVNLERIEKVEQVRRPQDPVPPLPYESREITFGNAAAGITFAGTLTLPDGGGRFPAAVLVSGSGPQNRDEEIFNHRPFLVISDYLARRGIAVLRYDDRGVGGSGGDGPSAREADLASDAAAAVDYLMTVPEIDNARVGIIGHSEGG